MKYGANGTLAGDWVAAFAPAVTGPVLGAEEWPEVVTLDEIWFGSTMPTTERRKRQALWTIWGAHAPGGPSGGGRLFRLWIRDYLANRDPRLPRSIGALEANLRKAKTTLKPRAHIVRNTARTQRMLDLMTLHLRGEDQADAYAARIREHLEANSGSGPDQRVGVTGGAHLH